MISARGARIFLETDTFHVYFDQTYVEFIFVLTGGFTYRIIENNSLTES